MLIFANCMNCWDHALCKALPRLPDLLASYSTKIENVPVHVFTGKLLIAMHFVLLPSILPMQTEQERGFTWLNRTSSWRSALGAEATNWFCCSFRRNNTIYPVWVQWHPRQMILPACPNLRWQFREPTLQSCQILIYPCSLSCSCSAAVPKFTSPRIMFTGG